MYPVLNMLLRKIRKNDRRGKYGAESSRIEGFEDVFPCQ